MRVPSGRGYGQSTEFELDETSDPMRNSNLQSISTPNQPPRKKHVSAAESCRRADEMALQFAATDAFCNTRTPQGAAIHGCCPMDAIAMPIIRLTFEKAARPNGTKGERLPEPAAQGYEKRRGRSRKTDPASHGGTLDISVSISCCPHAPTRHNHTPIHSGSNRRPERKGKFGN